MHRTIRAAALALTVVVGLGVATACEPTPTVTTASNTVDVRCAIATYTVETDWAFPSTTPKGLVWLQHGFTESKDDYDEMARKTAESGFVAMATTLPTADLFGCTVENLGNNTDFLNNVAAMLAGLGDTNSALGRSYADAATKAGRGGLAMPSKLLISGHSAGGEAVLYVANRLRTNHASTFARLKGLVLHDPVKSFIGNNTDSALDGLATTSLPIYSIAAPDNTCNNNQSGTDSVVAKLPGRFHGAVISGGTHGDVFGGSMNSLEQITCGAPVAANTNVVRTLTFAWYADMVAGTANPAFYPGGGIYDALVSGGKITTLP